MPQPKPMSDESRAQFQAMLERGMKREASLRQSTMTSEPPASPISRAVSQIKSWLTPAAKR